MNKTRDNHYVPRWYQTGFLLNNSNQLHYLDLSPDKRQLPDGRIVIMNDKHMWPTARCFFQTDLYTTFFGEYINDEIERILFGKIDGTGAPAIRAFIGDDVSKWHHHFTNFFSYIDSQKIRTPKGLDWIRAHYPNLGQIDLMHEMQAIRHMNCTIWTEGVREIISAEKSEIKFIITDHPVTTYNYAYPPESEQCIYPNDPSITLKGTQTIFPLDINHCLILTNYEYAKNPDEQDPTEKRTNARLIRNSMVRTDTFIKSRFLSECDVQKINFLMKKRSRRYIAAPKEDWLYPEKNMAVEWKDLRQVLLPPKNELWHYGGEMYARYEDGSVYYQDSFGRITPENEYLKKPILKGKLGSNELCGCGSGKKYKKCCMNKSESQRPSWVELSIRERNIILYNGINDILGLSKNKTWDDVRRELSDEQVKEIHKLYGFLWPIDTDIFSLLPKPDGTLRALYTGIIDPRVTFKYALGLAPYFDEVIIQHPFINPNVAKPDFSPVDSPSQHKQQTLKNVLMLFALMPFIEEGVVNFIPDPCLLDLHLHQQVLNMAEERAKDYKPAEKEKSLIGKLYEEDCMRTLYTLSSKDQKMHDIKCALPELSSKEHDQVFQHMAMKNLKDPLALLQSGTPGEGGGQLIAMNMLPNFEMSLFIAQLSGSLLLTDSPSRWDEIKKAQSRQDAWYWSELSNSINAYKYPIYPDPEDSFRIRSEVNFKNIRNVLREIYSSVQKNENLQNSNLSDRLKKEFMREREAIKNDELENYFYGEINCLIPINGFKDNNVHRMLLTCGIENHLNSVPMAIFVESEKLN